HVWFGQLRAPHLLPGRSGVLRGRHSGICNGDGWCCDVRYRAQRRFGAVVVRRVQGARALRHRHVPDDDRQPIRGSLCYERVGGAGGGLGVSRQIPVAIQSNLDNPVQYLTRCVRFRLKNGAALGFTMWDRDITYDHGDGYGPTVYSASQGIDPSTIAADVNYSVANSEGRILVSTTLQGLTLEMVEAGALDDGEWDCFLLDWRNPVTGSALLLDAGDIGEVRTED